MSNRNVHAVFVTNEKVLQELEQTIFTPQGAVKLTEQIHYSIQMLVNLLQNDFVNADKFILEIEFPPKANIISAPDAGEIVIRPFPLPNQDENVEIKSHSIVKVKNIAKNEVSVLYPLDIMKQMLHNFPNIKSKITKLNQGIDNGNVAETQTSVQTNQNSDATSAEDLVS